MAIPEGQNRKKRESTSKSVWQRVGTGRAKELRGTVPEAHAVGTPAPAGRPLRPSEAARPVALHTHSYTYVFGRLSHHTHRTQLQRAFCAGLHGAPPAEPNTAFYSELDERLRLQHSTLAAVHAKSVEESLAAAASMAGAAADEGGAGLGAGGVGGSGGAHDVPDTVALRHAVNSSLTQQMAFFTRCMAQYCTDGAGGGQGEAGEQGCGCACPPAGCSCACARQHGHREHQHRAALRAAARGDFGHTHG